MISYDQVFIINHGGIFMKKAKKGIKKITKNDLKKVKGGLTTRENKLKPVKN
jgi:bacteriocin-like protein